MRNMVDYVEQMLLPVEEQPFNAVDSLVLSQFCQIWLNEATPDVCTDDGVKMTDLFRAEGFGKMFFDMWEPQASKRMLTAMVASPRFRNTTVKRFVRQRDTVAEKQFGAVCVQFSPDLCYVAFRGTDSSVVGWKEDFNMAFQSPIPSQTEAVAYLRSVAENTDGNLILGGHSKGGNLAVYAAAYADEQTKQRIQRVYSHDGPGFLPQVLASDEFKSISNKIDKTVPQSSFVGMLLEAQESFRVIKSNRSNIMQHDPFSWETDGCEFVPVASLTATAGYLDKTLNGWINGLSESERKRLVDLLFAYVDSQNVANIDELLKYGKKNIIRALRAVSKETAETQKFVKQTIRSLLSLSVKNFPELLKDNGKSRTSNKDN